MIAAFGSCLAAAIVSTDMIKRRQIPALWVGVYGVGMAVSSAGNYSDGPRADIVAALALVAAASVSVGQDYVHTHVAGFVVAAHACCAVEHMSYDNRLAALWATVALDSFAALIVLYGRWKATKKEV